MASKFRKRKHRGHEESEASAARQSPRPDPSLYIQAHEADLVRGPQAAAAARSLEVIRRGQDGKVLLEVGDGLIRWNGGGGDLQGLSSFEEDRFQLGQVPKSDGRAEDAEAIWVDRYDARLLLDALPRLLPWSTAEEADSPGGWSDLPSDAEDTFFFSPEEVEDYRREKRRRVIDGDREARLRALRSEGDEDEDEPVDPRDEWGGSDEEPDDVQLELMRRTASHVLASPNPAQLEMRILANHGADPRFAFLRGRWSRSWRLTKGKLRLELEKTRAAKEKEAAGSGGAGIGGLVGYGDSDEEDEEGSGHEGENDAKPPAEQVTAQPVEGGTGSIAPDDALKAARRVRAREWAEKRRAAKEATAAREVGS
ncbi:hypothetical protein BV20DRAFT_966203 [Pilatotrama ljubarskyi]|nr:hypothetical protein BV20DRAFT_966203 [Pilatotrama ljubarskyi]